MLSPSILEQRRMFELELERVRARAMRAVVQLGGGDAAPLDRHVLDLEQRRSAQRGARDRGLGARLSLTPDELALMWAAVAAMSDPMLTPHLDELGHRSGRAGCSVAQLALIDDRPQRGVAATVLGQPGRLDHARRALPGPHRRGSGPEDPRSRARCAQGSRREARMISPALAALREHVRRGDLDAARAVAIPAEDAGVAAVYLALAAGDRAAAASQALTCLDAGRAERVVIATVVAHVPRTDPRWVRAATQLELVDALAEVAERPGDGAAWEALLELLVDTRRREVAWEAVRAASNDGAGEEPWQRLISALVEAGDPERALVVARDACMRFASATLWAMRAIVAVETDYLDEAEAAVDDAHRLDARSPLAWVARSRLAWARGDDAVAVAAASTAIDLGAPRPAVEAGARGARMLQLLLAPR